jgi:selenide,water dikinase
VVIGIVDPRNVKRNAGAQAGDVLILGKPLGVGIYSAALKKGKLPATGYRAMIDSTTQLNTPGIALGAMAGVHALTDVTGFGLAGHLLEICRASKVRATLDWSKVPLHPHVEELAADGLVTGASARNWNGCGDDVTLSPALPATAKALLTDPQTSGGLLVAAAPDATQAVIDAFRREGFLSACVIGELGQGAAQVDVR